MPVVANADGAGALAGTVVGVTDDTARIRFIVDTRSAVIGVDQASRALGEVRGQAGGQLVMSDVPVTEEVAVGDTIVSAGLAIGEEASRYPGGLLIGTVQAVEDDANALTQTAFVRPAFDVAGAERLLSCSISARAEHGGAVQAHGPMCPPRHADHRAMGFGAGARRVVREPRSGSGALIARSSARPRPRLPPRLHRPRRRGSGAAPVAGRRRRPEGRDHRRPGRQPDCELSQPWRPGRRRGHSPPVPAS